MSNDMTGSGFAPNVEPKSQGLAIAGMVLGIVGLVLAIIPCFWWLGMCVSVVGIALSGVAMRFISTGSADGKGKAVTGLVCGIVGVAIGTLWLALTVLVHTAAVTATDSLN